MAGLTDVARLAGVSVATASRVLNGSSHPVSADVRRRVSEAAARLGYTPSAAAQSLKSKKSKIVGVIVGDIVDPYFAEMTTGIETVASASGYVTVVANGNRDPEQELRQFQALREHRAAGIIFCGSDMVGSPQLKSLTREVDDAVAGGAHVVALAPRGFDGAKLVIDNEAAGRELTEYLLSLGHRRIVYIGGMPGLVAAELRAKGYRIAMEDFSCQPAVCGQVGMDQRAGQEAVISLLGSSAPIDAFICVNDEVAIGAMAALWKARVRVPDDVSVAGIGGTRGGEVFGLTTMKLPLAELGALAAKTIIDPEASPDMRIPTHELIVRTSTKNRMSVMSAS